MSDSTLKEKIQSLRHRNAHGETYVPTLSLNNLLHRDLINAELQRAGIPAQYIDEIANPICEGGKVSFAILVLIGEVAITRSLVVKRKLKDDFLPFNRFDLSEIGLTEDTNYEFCRTQWQFLSPSFTRGTLCRHVRDKCVLPFVKDEKLGAGGSGGFGTVYEIQLDGQNQTLNVEFQQPLVRKELRTDVSHPTEMENGESQLAETKNLAILNHLNHPNILELLASYKYKGSWNLIFPLADGGDLQKLLASDRHNTPFQSDETVFFGLAGLASAIENVHGLVSDKLNLRLLGCHHDLRPRNIFVSGQKFLLADFGLSRFTTPSNGSRMMPERLPPDDYIAPECEDLEDNFKKAAVGRASDIWSFGCILLQVLVYMHGGPQAITQFRSDRKFKMASFTMALFHQGKNEPNQSVETYIARMESKFSRRLSFLFELIRQMLSQSETNRPRAEIVAACLRTAAVSQTVESTDEQFKRFCEQHPSLEASVQFLRYQAWTCGIELEGADVGLSTAIRSGRTVKFQETISCLTEMKEVLRAASSPLSGEDAQTWNLRRISELNDKLLNLLGPDQRDIAQMHLTSSVVQSKLSANKDIPLLGREIQMLNALKEMTQLADSDSGLEEHDYQIRPENVHTKGSFDNHELATLTESSGDYRVLVEWRRYGRKEGDDTMNEKLFARLKQLVELLKVRQPKGLRSLECCGYFHKPTDCAFGVPYKLYAIPPLASDGPEPCTLHQMLRDLKDKLAIQPLLECKFDLACTLARAVLKFHIVGWLHKDLTSFNVIFVNGKSPISERVKEPYIIGFNHSRPGDPSAMTEGTPDSERGLDYRHPEYQQAGSGYKREWDYYSLGIILLEIGIWKPLCHWVTSWRDRKLDPVNDIRRKLIDARVPMLGPCMGSEYEEAVRICLEGDFGEQGVGSGGQKDLIELHREFEKRVVGRLMNPVGRMSY